MVPKSQIFALIIIFGTTGCGASSNLLGLTVPQSHKESFEYRLSQGQAEFDSGNLAEAKKHADRAYELNPRSEKAAILFGFVYLSLAGADPFTLAGKMATSGEGSDEDGSEQTSSEDEGTSGELGKIESVIGLTAEEKFLLGSFDETDPELPVLVPVCAEEGRVLVEKLYYLDLAIGAICPFVDEAVLIEGAVRHQCDVVSRTLEQQSKSHFLWAFTHLTEALAFNSILTFKTGGGKKTNLELRVDKIKEQDVSGPDELNDFLEKVKSIEETVNAVLPLSDSCSELYATTMLVATLNDLLAVDAAFGTMAGIPPKITEGITKAVEKINKIQGSGGKLASLKGDLTKKMSATLSEKFDQLETDLGEVPDTQKTALCSTFDTISAGSADPPELCGGESSE